MEALDVAAADAFIAGTLSSQRVFSDPGLLPELLLLPGGERLTRGEAARALAQMEKPIVCRASLNDRTMVLECRTIDRAADRRDPRMELMTRKLRAVRALSGPGRVLIQGPNQSAMVTVAVVEKMFRDYVIDWSYAVTTDPGELEGIDAVAIMLVDQVDVEIHILPYPPPDDQ